VKTLNPLVEILESSDESSDLCSDLVRTLLPRENRNYTLQIASMQDYEDVDAILSALKIFPQVLEKFSDFNNWDANPLITVNEEHVKLLQESHPYSTPRWLREVCDIRVTPGWLSFDPLSLRKAEATVRVGFFDQSQHILLLAIASRFELYARIIIRSSAKMCILIFADCNNSIIPVLFVDSDQHGNEVFLKHFRENAKKDRVIIKIPTNMESYRLFFDSASGGMKMVDVDAYHSIPARVESKIGASQPPGSKGEKQWEEIFSNV